MRPKGEARQLVVDALAQAGDGVSGDIAKETGLTLGYVTLLLRQLVMDGQAVRVRHGVYRAVGLAGSNGKSASDPQAEHLASLRRGAKGDDTDTTALANVSRIVTAMSNHYSRKALQYGPLSPTRAQHGRVAVSLELAKQHVQRAVSIIRGEEP